MRTLHVSGITFSVWAAYQAAAQSGYQSRHWRLPLPEPQLQKACPIRSTECETVWRSRWCRFLTGASESPPKVVRSETGRIASQFAESTHRGSILESPVYNYRVFERFLNLAAHVPILEHAIPKAFIGDDHWPSLFTGSPRLHWSWNEECYAGWASHTI